MKTFYCIVLCSYFLSACTAISPSIGKKLQNQTSTISFKLPSKTPNYPKNPKNFLFLIAATKYPKPKKRNPKNKEWENLNNPVRDAKALKEVLENQYNFNRIFECYDNDFTIANVDSIFKVIEKKASVRDKLIVYYSGHGHKIENKAGNTYGYFVPPNTYQTKDYLSHQKFLGYINAFKNKKFRHILVIADACFAGAMIQPKEGTKPSPKEGKDKGSTGGRLDISRWGMTSGLIEEVKDGPKGGHSPFAQVLIDQLRQSSKDCFSTKELMKAVIANVKGQNAIERALPNDFDGKFMLYNYQGTKQHLGTPGVRNHPTAIFRSWLK